MNDLYYELFYFCAKFYGHTNKNIPIVFVVFFGIIALIIFYIINKLTKNKTMEIIRDAFAVAIVMTGVFLCSYQSFKKLRTTSR